MVEKDKVDTLEFDCRIWLQKECLVEEARIVDVALAARRQSNEVRGARHVRR